MKKKLPMLLTEIRDKKKVPADVKKIMLDVGKDTMTDREYNKMLQRTRGGKPCEGCD